MDEFFKKSFNTKYPKRSSDVMDYKMWENTEYFTDFHLKNRYFYVAINDVHYKDELVSTISLVREKKDRNFSDKELVFLRLLSPHVANQLQKLKMVDDLKKINRRNIIELIGMNEERYHLSTRESEILELAFKGMSNKDISDELYISSETVKKHLNTIFKKCKVSSRMELMAKVLNII